MGFKTKRIQSDQSKNELNKVYVKNPAFVLGTASTHIAAGQIVRISGIDGGFLEVTEALQADPGELWVALDEIRDYGRITKWYILDLDTSSVAAESAVWLSKLLAGAPTLTKPAGMAVRIGRTLTSAAAGKVLLDTNQSLGDAGDTSTIIADPGSAGAIPVTSSGTCALVTLGAETRTIALPTFIGQVIVLTLDTDGGNCVVTAANSVTSALAEDVMTFTDVGETITLRGVSRGGSVWWSAQGNDGVVLS